MNRLKMAAELRMKADKLEREHYRPMPDKWGVGMRVKYLNHSDWAWSKGDEAVIVEVMPEYENKKSDEYQVFYTSPPNGKGVFWTTPDDVELVVDESIEDVE